MSRPSGQAPGSPLRIIVWCSAALFVPLAFPLLTGRVFTKDDLAALHLPFRFLYQEALRSGEFLWWTPAFHAGFFLHGAGEAAMAHPWHVALYWFLPLGLAFNLEILSSYFFLFAGTGLLLRRLKLSIEGAAFGAMTVTFSGFMLFNLMHMNHIATFAHSAWLLLACHWLMTSDASRHRAWAFAAVAVVEGSQCLSGNPQYVWLTLVAVGYLVVCLVLAGYSAWRLGLVAGAWALGLLIGGVQLLPAYAFFQESTRAAFSPEQALTFSLAPLNLIQLWAPFAFEFRVFAPPSEEFIIHEFIVYNGAFCTLALAWVAMRWREQQNQALLVMLLGFAALALLLAFGRYGGAYPWLAQLPGLKGLRAPSRHIVLFQMALGGIAAIAFEDLAGVVQRGERIALSRLWPLAVPVVLSIATTAVAAILAGSAWAAQHGMRFSTFWRGAPWSMFVVGMFVLIVFASRGARWALALVIVAAATDQGAWGYSYAYRWGPIKSIAELTAEAQVPPDAHRGDSIPPVPGGHDSLAILRGLRLTNAYTGLYPTSVVDFADPTVERLAGIKWRGDGDRWHPVDDSLPRARLVATARATLNTAADLRTTDITQIALVGHPLALWGSRGSARVDLDRPGAIEVETFAEGRQLLILTERFHQGWRATVDDVAQETTLVYGNFLGCVVEPGRHRVRLVFAPDSVRKGLRLTLAGIVLTALGTWIVGRPRMQTMS